MIFLSLFLLTITGIALFYSVKRNIQLMDKLEEIDDALDNVVSVLETQHQKIDAKTRIEVFSDEPIIRELIQDISTARDVVKSASEILKEIEFSIDSQDDEENQDDEKSN